MTVLMKLILTGTDALVHALVIKPLLFHVPVLGRDNEG